MAPWVSQSMVWTPLKNMSSSIGMMIIPNINGKKKFMATKPPDDVMESPIRSPHPIPGASGQPSPGTAPCSAVPCRATSWTRISRASAGRAAPVSQAIRTTAAFQEMLGKVLGKWDFKGILTMVYGEKTGCIWI